MKYKLGLVYMIEWYDHFSTENKSPEEATTHQDVVLTSWGMCVGTNRKYVILAQNWENDISQNNDNIHIIKQMVKYVKVLK